MIAPSTALQKLVRLVLRPVCAVVASGAVGAGGCRNEDRLGICLVRREHVTLTVLAFQAATKSLSRNRHHTGP